MMYANEIEGCFESVFREIGTSDETWYLMYRYFLDAIDVRSLDSWAQLLIDEGMSKEKAFHHIERFIKEKNDKSN